MQNFYPEIWEGPDPEVQLLNLGKPEDQDLCDDAVDRIQQAFRELWPNKAQMAFWDGTLTNWSELGEFVEQTIHFW